MSVTRIRHSLSSGLTFDFSTFMIQSSWFSSISLFAAHAHKSVPHVYICVFVCLTIFYFWTDFQLWPWIQMHIIVHHSVSSYSLMRVSKHPNSHSNDSTPDLNSDPLECPFDYTLSYIYSATCIKPCLKLRFFVFTCQGVFSTYSIQIHKLSVQ